MAYTAQGSLTGWESLPQLRALLDGQRLDLGHGGEYAALYAEPLALLHDAADHPEGDRQLALDGRRGGHPHGGGHGSVYAVHGGGAAGDMKKFPKWLYATWGIFLDT